MSDKEDFSERKKHDQESSMIDHNPKDSGGNEKRDNFRKTDRDSDRKRNNYREINKKRKSPDLDGKRSDDRNYKRRRGDRDYHRRRRDRNSSQREFKNCSRRDAHDDRTTFKRYWDTGRKNESKFRDRFESDDEVEVGERFYGEKTDHDRNCKNDNEHERRKENEPPENEISRSAETPPVPKKTVDMLTSRTGGAYIPPAKLRMMQAEISDKSGPAYQRIAWEALKKSIHGHINKVNTSNIGIIVRELLKENIVRGRGLLTRSIIQAQAASPTFTPVYAALTSVINSKFPDVGELVLKRLLNQFKRSYRRNDKPLCISSGTFIAHLVNQSVAHDLLALEILMLLTENPTDDSIEIGIAILKECGMKLTETSKKGIECIFTSLRSILHEGALDKRVQYMIEVVFQIRKDGFKDHEAIPEGLDLVEEEDQITHVLEFEDKIDSEDILNVFKFDSDYISNEERYKRLIKEILDTDSSGSEDEQGEDESEEDNEAEEDEKQGVIIDNTETNLKALRRTIYLTIHSSLDFEECAHKLLKMQMKPGQEIELCHMILDCCAENRTYEKFFGLLAGRFCAIKQIYVTPFEQIFRDSYDTIYRLDTNKLRNVANFFAHLFCTDSISWEAMSCIKLNENDTNSSGRVFIKILFQKLSEDMSLAKLNERLKDPTLHEAFSGLFPRDDPRNTRFSINFFTTIGLGGLTDDLREHLQSRPKPVSIPQIALEDESSSSENSTSSSSDTSSSSSSDSSDSEDSSENRKRRMKVSSKKRESKYIETKVKKRKEEEVREKRPKEIENRDQGSKYKEKQKKKNRERSREKECRGGKKRTKR